LPARMARSGRASTPAASATGTVVFALAAGWDSTAMTMATATTIAIHRGAQGGSRIATDPGRLAARAARLFQTRRLA
jgi:hypothetical protein